MKKWRLSAQGLGYAVVSIGFILWSWNFIYLSSFKVANQGRFYSLFDDAMISMRYAWNFSHGNGLVWNTGEYVQGYTNLLMTLVMSLATMVLSKPQAVLAIQILGAVLVLSIAFLTMQISDYVFTNTNENLRSFLRILAFICGLAYYPLAYWSLMGMETGLLAFLVLWATLMTFRYVKTRNRATLIWASLLFGLAFLTRNDSIIFFLLALCYLGLMLRQTNGRIEFGSLARYLLPYFAMAAGELLFQRLYYGEFLPNTYTLKLTGMPLVIRLQNGIGFVIPFLQETMLILALAAMGVVLSYQWEKLLLFLMMAAAILYQVYIGGDPWNYWRMMAPMMTITLILNMDALFHLGNWLLRTPIMRRFRFYESNKSGELFLAAFMLLFLGWAIAKADVRFWPEMSFHRPAFTVPANQSNIVVANVLNQVLCKRATIGVFRAGTVPYYTSMRAIDFLGKSDRYIAHLPPDLSGNVKWNGMFSVPGHNKYDLAYSIILLRPTYVQRLSWGGEDLSIWAQGIYVQEKYKSKNLYLLHGSPDVRWNILANATR